MVNFAQLRLQARKALKNNWQIALLVAFIAALPNMMSEMVTILRGNTLTDVLMGELQSGALYAATDPNYVLRLVQAQAGNTYMLRNVLSIVSWLVTPFLTLGLLNYLQQLLDGKAGYITEVFSRRKCFFKGIGLQIMTALKTALWALPGIAMLVAVMVAAVSSELSSQNASGSMTSLLLILLYASYLLIIVPTVMAYFRYALSMNVMAEHPEYGIMQCIGVSKSLMKRRKFMLFGLEFSFIGWLLLVGIIGYALSSFLGSVIGDTVYMFINLALSVYLQTAICAFYKEFSAEDAGGTQEGFQPS